MSREHFKQAFVQRLIELGFDEPEDLEPIVACLRSSLTGEKQASLWSAISAVPDLAGKTIKLVPTALGAARDTLFSGLGIAGTVGALGLGAAAVPGAISGYGRAKLEALDDETPDELRERELAEQYSSMADQAEARARTVAGTRARQSRKTGRPVL